MERYNKIEIDRYNVSWVSYIVHCNSASDFCVNMFTIALFITFVNNVKI